MKILSIDLDFIMPQLGDVEFLEFNSKRESPDEYWKKFFSKHNINICTHSNSYFFVDQIIDLLNKYKSDVVYIEKHQDILNIIGDKKVELVNLDQHHDIYYSFEDKNAALDSSKTHLLESSWVYYLYIRGQLTSYTWVANNNSTFNNELLRFPFRFFIEDNNSYQDPFGIESEIFRDLGNKSYDKVIFVRSPYYLPKTKQVDDIIKKINKLIKK